MHVPDPTAEHARRCLDAARAATRGAGYGVYLGHGPDGWSFAPPGHAVLVLGPPRSGKTSALVVPNVLAAAGAVLSTSTKRDVLDATASARAAVGTCRLFDPAGAFRHHRLPAGVQAVRWSPVPVCSDWDTAQLTARRAVATGPAAAGGAPARVDGGDHWTERAGTLLAPLLHAAALDGASMTDVVRWVDRRDPATAAAVLARTPGTDARLAGDALDGVVSGDQREVSGIWSTASGSLAGYRTSAALDAARDPDFDAEAFVASGDTLYLCAPADRQALVAPMVVGLVDAVRAAAFRRGARGGGGPPVVLLLDEVANIAPLPDLPALVSEGGGQGVTVVACFQDLSQARHRWGARADGFPSLFGTTVVLPGIGDVTTLRALSQLAGDVESVRSSTSVGRVPSGHRWADAVTGGVTRTTVTRATVTVPRLPVDTLAHGRPGHAVAFDHRNVPGWVHLAPAHSHGPWRDIVDAGRGRAPGAPDRRYDLGR
jgi:type IV secretory pathway TraG/TraD family ATPase VirD4